MNLVSLLGVGIFGFESLLLLLLVVLTVAIFYLAGTLRVIAEEIKLMRRDPGTKRGILPEAPAVPAPVPPPLPAEPAAASQPGKGDEVSSDVFAAVVAAVHYTLGAGHRVVSIRPTYTLWSQEGRRTIFGSHVIR